MNTPPEPAEETTQQLPTVPPAQQSQPEHLTAGLPLLDLLAPQQTGAQPPPAQPLPGQPGEPQYGEPQYGEPVHPEPLYVEPHHAEAPESQYPAGQYPAAQYPAGPEGQYPPSQYPETPRGETLFGDQQYAQPLYSESGYAESQYPESQYPESQYPESQYQEAPYGEQYVPLAPYGASGPYDPAAAPAPVPTFPPVPSRSNRKLVLLLGAAGVVLLLAAIIGAQALRSSPSSAPSATTAPVQVQRTSSAATSTSVAQSSTVSTAGGYQFAQHAARTDTDCAANAYGRVAEFFRATPCTSLERVLYSSTTDGRLVVVSLSVVQMPDEGKAAELRKLADTSGTGNVDDLLRAGVRVPGGPESFTSAGYASGQNGAVVVIAESDFADEAIRDGDLLDQVSRAALELRR